MIDHTCPEGQYSRKPDQALSRSGTLGRCGKRARKGKLANMFDDLALDRRLRLGLDTLEFGEPTEIQALVVPAALEGRDIIASAETGSGKTLAYLLPLAQHILAASARNSTGTLALVLVPTRELARQVLKHARQLLARSPIQVAAITGGADFKYQRSLLRKDPEILVATPGRMLEHCERGSTELGALQALVLDEADRMLDMGFREDVLKIAGYCPGGRQVMLLSATLSHRGVKTIARELLESPEIIQVGSRREAPAGIFHQAILADNTEHKDQLLPTLLQQGGFQRALVFAGKRTTAARLAGMLGHRGLRCGCLHGELSTEQRKQVMQQFADGKLTVLCASDVAARGLDIAGIDLVVNYDLPTSGDDYLHRCGRTGRAGASGMAVSLVAPPDWNLMISIQRYLGLEFERRALPGLKARYNGPKKQKSSGKAAGKKKKRDRKPSEKRRSRERNRKDRGKPAGNDGFAPLTRKKRSED
jgi:superfamily II DNA/RNA helicase